MNEQKNILVVDDDIDMLEQVVHDPQDGRATR